MTFVKITKSKAYFKRFQTRFRRRREAKTDYRQRKGLIIQDLNRYLMPKYRLVARITNSKVIAQIAYSTYAGDRVLCQADSRELSKFGLTTGFTSFSAAYATGLLLARRCLTDLKMGDAYKGTKEINGQDYDVANEENPDRRPFIAVLDIGLRRPTIGNRVFAVMKGACDGGINVPHSAKKFAGFDKEKQTFDPVAHKKRIFGGHIDEYMAELKDDSEALKKQFSKWSESLKKAGAQSVEDLFKKIFDEIRKNPGRPKKEKKETKTEYKDKDKKTQVISAKAKKGFYIRDRRLNAAERKARVEAKIKAAKEQLAK